MTKKVLLAAMGAALSVSSFAQAPVLRHVKTINVPILGNNVLENHFITAVAADGSQLFYAGTGNGANEPYATPVVKVADWTKPIGTNDHTVIFRDENGVPGNPGALGGWQVQLFQNGGNLYFASSLGSANTSRNGTEVYRLDYNGNLVTSADGNFVDGVLNQDPINEFFINLGNSLQDFTIDPGFGGDANLAYIISGSRVVRRNSLVNGNTVGPTLGHNVNLVTMRSIAFDSAGNAFMHASNSIHKAVRNAQDGSTFTGFDDPTVIFSQPLSTAQFPNVEVIPGDAGSDEFVMATDYTAPTGTGLINIFRASDGSTVGYPTALTGTPTGEFANRVQNFTSTKIGDTRYVFISNIKAGSQNAVDVYQIGEDGKVTLNLALNNYDGTATGSRTITIVLRDAGNNIVDQRSYNTPAGTPAAGSVTFYTPARGTVTVSAKANGFLRNSIIGTSGSSTLSGTIALTPGDVDNSGEIDAADIDLVIADFGATPTVGNDAPTDVDGSGEVDAADIDLVIANFGLTDI